ncbi:hypothetical protein ACFXPY_43685 [Streptomyces sp. NPDC059153]|uniref:hypothetical protein n=1 Tax=Streptomyces sp. NPDC059153 TaxID=3346743 RepID=UPI0036A1032F
MDSDEVADRPAESTASGPAGRVPHMGGPEIRPLIEPARASLGATGRKRPQMPARPAGKAYAGDRRGDHLSPEPTVEIATFEEFPAERFSRPG